MDWDALEKANRRPRAFDPGDGLFWADPYIADHVVYAHLDDRSDDAGRPLKTVRAEADFVDGLVPGRGRLLDLGCGVGRHSQLLAARGWSVTGLDAAGASLNYARGEAADAGLMVDYRQADLRTAGLPADQNLILIAYGTLGTLSPADARRLIRRCRRALAPGGLLVFDLFRRRWFDRQLAAAPKSAWDVVAEEGFWSPSPHLVLSRTDAYPRLRAFGRTYTIVEKDRTRRFPLWYRWYDPEHVSAELVPGARVRFYGGLDGRRFTPRSEWTAAVVRWEE